MAPPTDKFPEVIQSAIDDLDDDLEQLIGFNIHSETDKVNNNNDAFNEFTALDDDPNTNTKNTRWDEDDSSEIGDFTGTNEVPTVGDRVQMFCPIDSTSQEQ